MANYGSINPGSGPSFMGGPSGGGGSFMGGPMAAGGGIQNGMNQHDYWNYIPEAGYAELMRQGGYQGADPYSRYAQSQYNRYYQMYQGDAARDPNMGFYDWYMGKGFDPRSEFQNLAPSQRGDSTSSFLTPRARWSMG